MIIVRESAPNQFEPVHAGDIESLDGDRRAPLAVILHETWSAAERAEFGIYLVDPVPVPAGQHATSSGFARVDGSVVQVHQLEPIALADLKAQRVKEVEALLQAAFLEGYTPTEGPLAGHTLQVRDAEDRTNWLTSQASYSAAVAGGFGDVVDADFRTAANDTVTVSYASGLNVLLGMAAWGRGLMGKSWALKDWIGDPARTRAEIEAMDVAAQWAAA